jgi:alpha-mannosidase
VFLNAGLPEYAVDGESVSITLLRAVSLLSREKLLTRGGGAGPYLPTPGANCLGTNRTTYGWAPLGPGSDHDQQVIEAYRMAEQFEGRLWTSLAFRDVKERSTSFVKLDNQAIRLVSLHTVGGSRDIVLRLLNVTSKPQQARLRTAFPCRDASLCNLNGDVCKVLFSSHNDSAPPGAMLLPLDLQENELITLKLSMLSS